MFPNISYHVIALRLEENQENEEKTIESLLLDPPVPKPPSNISKWGNFKGNMAAKLRLDSLKVKKYSAYFMVTRYQERIESNFIELKNQPPTLVGKLMSYQQDGLNWLLYSWFCKRNAILGNLW